MALPELDVELLEALTQALLRRARTEGEPAPPALIALPFGDPSMYDETGFAVLAQSMVGCGDPLEFLCHIRPAPEWIGLGLLIDGWMKTGDNAFDARTLAREGGRLRDDPESQHGRILQLVATSGAVSLGMDDGEEITIHSMVDGSTEDGPIGPLLEGMRRMLGLPTPPCPVPVEQLWATEWLGRIHRRYKRRRRHSQQSQSWDEIASLHPALALAREVASHGEVVPTDWLVPAGRALARTRSWSDLQLGCVTGDWPVEGVSAAVAAWADEPMFARLVLRGTPPLWGLVPALRRRIEPANLLRIEDALAEWGLDWQPPSGGG